ASSGLPCRVRHRGSRLSRSRSCPRRSRWRSGVRVRSRENSSRAIERPALGDELGQLVALDPGVFIAPIRGAVDADQVVELGGRERLRLVQPALVVGTVAAVPGASPAGTAGGAALRFRLRQGLGEARNGYACQLGSMGCGDARLAHLGAGTTLCTLGIPAG